MKIWKWYKNLTTEEFEASADLSVEDKYPLYAFTTDKKFRDLWREMRKKESFIEKKSSISQEDYVKFTNNHRRQLLGMYNYTKLIGYTKSREPETAEVSILTTWDEKENTEAILESMSDRNSGTCIQDYPFCPLIISDKYFFALYNLQYVAFWKMYSQEIITPIQEQLMERLGADLDYSYPEVGYDEFSAFISLYSSTLKL